MTQANDYITPIVFDNYVPNGEQKNRLTKREYFAAMAMQGILSSLKGYDPSQAIQLSECSVILADGLINALNEKP